MRSLAELIRQIAGSQLGTVIHIGAGAVPTLGDDSGLNIRRLVLVEGDPEMAGDLATRVGTRPGIEVVQEVITDAGQVLTWNRFSLSTLNGACDPGALTGRFPRLRLLSSKPASSMPIAALLTTVDPGRSDDLPNVLMLDVPGQSARLAEALTAASLKGIDWIVLRDLRHLAVANGAAFSAAARALEHAHFQRSEVDAALDTDPLWAHAALRFDAAAARHGRVTAELEQATQERDRALAKLEVDAGERASLQRRLTELQARVQVLEAATDESARLRQQLDDALASVRGERDEANSQLAARARQLALLETRLLEQHERSHEQEVRVQEGAIRGVELHAAREQQADAIVQLEARARQIEGLEAKLAEQHAQLEAAVARHEDLDAVRQQQADAIAQLEVRAQRVEVMDGQLEQQRAEIAAAAARHAELDSVRQQQADAIAHLEAQVRQAAALETDLQEQHGQAAAAAARYAELEALRQRQASAIAQLETRVQQATLLETQLRDCHAQVTAAAVRHDELDIVRQQQADAIAQLELRTQRTTSLETQLQEQSAQAAAAVARLAELQAVRQQQDDAIAQLEVRAQRTVSLETQLQEQLARVAAADARHEGLLAVQRQQDDAIKQLEDAAQKATSLAAQLHEQQAQVAATLAGNDELMRVQQQLGEQLETTRKERDEQAHWHAENSKWAKSLQADNQRITAEIGELQQDRARLSREHGEATSLIESLRRELADRDQRQHLIDREVLRAEAQLDLIKDVLIREKNF